MAEGFKVFYNRSVAGNQLPTTTSFTKAEAEEKCGSSKVTHAIKLKGPIEECKVVEVEAETAAEACVAARVLVGANEAEGEFLVAKASVVEKKPGR